MKSWEHSTASARGWRGQLCSRPSALQRTFQGTTPTCAPRFAPIRPVTTLPFKGITGECSSKEPQCIYSQGCPMQCQNQVLLWISSPIVPVTGNLLECFGEWLCIDLNWIRVVEPGSHRQHDRLLPQDIMNVFLPLFSEDQRQDCRSSAGCCEDDLRRWVGIRSGRGGGMSIRTCGCESAEYDGSRADWYCGREVNCC